MRNIGKKIVFGLLSALMIFGILTPSVSAISYAYDINLDYLNALVEEQLLNFVEENDLSVELENIIIELNSDYISDGKGFMNTLELELNTIKESLLYAEMELIEQPLSPIERLIHNGGTSYRARVWGGVPAIGWGWINQDFTASVSNGRISNVRLQGNSYITGFLIGRWSHIRSWHELHTNNTRLDMRMRGTLSYGVGQFSITMSATFLQQLRGNGNRLVQR